MKIYHEIAFSALVLGRRGRRGMKIFHEIANAHAIEKIKIKIYDNEMK